MAERMPLLFPEDEIVRLHDIAYAAAIQTGAKGIELDEITSQIFRAMATQANRAVIEVTRKPKLRVVE